MKLRIALVLFAATICTAPAWAASDPVGMAAKGGYPEYLFLDKTPRAEAAATAEKLARIVIAARMIIFSYAGKFVDPAVGDKGFSGEFFERQWRAAVEPEMIDATPNQKKIVEKLFWAGRQVIENNQDRLNVKGIAWKHFLPAKWEREMGQVFTARTGIIIKQPGRAYRSPVNVPDDLERSVLQRFADGGRDDNKPYAAYTTMGKQAVYRYMEPIRLIPPCLSCHGKPKGEPDMLGFEKDGLEAGDVIGLMSVTIGVRE
jgi:general secretion pathway protein A